MPFGYTGNILRIDLSEKKVEVEQPTEYFYRTYGGGACFGAYYLLKELPPKVDPFSLDNIIIFAGSVVNGAPVPGFARCSIIFKSPLTGAIADTQAGGYFGPEMKFAGFDAIVIKGKADKPVYVWVHDEKAEIRDASHIWGKTTGEAEKIIKEEVGDKRAVVAVIGQAGENLVRYACVVNNLRHVWGRLGAGAVMGSKNLKAVVIRGRKKVEVKDRETVVFLAKHFSKNFMTESPINAGLYDIGTSQCLIPQNMDGQLPTMNFQTGFFKEAERISGQRMRDTVLIKREGCYACPVKCKRVVKVEEVYQVDPMYGGPEYETLCLLGSNCGIGDLNAICKANELCNKFGLDTISTGANIAFAMECYEKGILNKNDTNGIDLRFGNKDAMIKMVEMIAKRQGLGDILAEGVKKAAQRIGKNSREFAVEVKGEEVPGHDPRVKGHLALSYSLSPIGADHMVAEHDGLFTPGWGSFFAERVKPLGILEPLPLSSIDSRKVRRFFYFQLVYSMYDTLDLCIFAFAPVRYFTLPQLVTLVKAITGWETSLWELMKLGERRINMFRAFNIREGFTKEDDWLPKRMFEGILNGPRRGQKVNKDDLYKARDLYYEMAGWNSDGVPTEGKLAELDLLWIADELKRHGKLNVGEK